MSSKEKILSEVEKLTTAKIDWMFKATLLMFEKICAVELKEHKEPHSKLQVEALMLVQIPNKVKLEY